MTSACQPQLRTYRPSDEDALVSLWSRCGLLRPWNDPRRDIERKLAHDGAGFLVLEDGDRLAGAVMAGYDGHRGWVNYLAVDPAYQGQGLGRMLMREAERYLLAAGCPKVNLQVRAPGEHAVAFYRHLGYHIDDVVSMGKRLIDDLTAQQPPDLTPARRASPQAPRGPGSGQSASLPAPADTRQTLSQHASATAAHRASPSASVRVSRSPQRSAGRVAGPARAYEARP